MTLNKHKLQIGLQIHTLEKLTDGIQMEHKQSCFVDDILFQKKNPGSSRQWNPGGFLPSAHGGEFL